MHGFLRAAATLSFVVAVASILRAADPGVPGPPPQGAALLKVDLMGVFAHPDDETGAAGTLAAYALGRGATVANVYCTRGEGGGNMVGTQAGPALGILREAELRRCLDQLGVRYCYFLDQADFAYTESLSITLQRWGHEETLRRLVRLMRALRPEVILTMNPAPNPGQHGNHQAAGLLAIEAFQAAADPMRFPEQIRYEGLSAWQPRKLYYGGPAGTGATLDLSQPLPDGRTPGQVAGTALSEHRSQGFGGMAKAPWLRRPQSWTLVQSVVPFETEETDLFRGLPVNGDTPPRLFAPGDVEVSSVVRLEVRPRPAVRFYQQWIRDQRIGHVAQEFRVDVPVVAGEPNELSLEAVNPTGSGKVLEVNSEPPSGWQSGTSIRRVRVPAGTTVPFTVEVTPPAGTPPDAEFTWTARWENQTVQSQARLHPVPKLMVPRVVSAPPLQGEEGGSRWESCPWHEIPAERTWQGTVTNAADCSARFRLGHDRTALYVEVQVRDDYVVSNIEPNDIKGHWRSDSIELCFDPAPGSEHTMGCYKLGIFPFDTRGVVRAARDADARPGPVEETAPGTRLVSWRTAKGYAVRAAIPLSELGWNPRATQRRLGFNVLVYDGDKTNAAPGENINRSRLAWAPRSGVQGRPEDWGRAVLE